MQITSVNLGQPRRLTGPSFHGETGIFKSPVTEPVMVGELGLAGDVVLNATHHGGPDQAVYVYRQEDYDWWSKELGSTVDPGTFGDNLTVQGLPEPGLIIGSRIVFDSVVLEATAPRIPCNTLAERMSDPGFARRFMQAERPGTYCRVMQTGLVRVGDAFAPEGGDPGGVSTLDIFRAASRRLSAEELIRFLGAPIDIRTRRNYEARLAKLRGPDTRPTDTSA
jgi:MOSC domain-containing protein YiiM